jgi:hypothetical protein
MPFNSAPFNAQLFNDRSITVAPSSRFLSIAAAQANLIMTANLAGVMALQGSALAIRNAIASASSVIRVDGAATAIRKRGANATSVIRADGAVSVLRRLGAAPVGRIIMSGAATANANYHGGKASGAIFVKGRGSLLKRIMPRPVNPGIRLIRGPRPAG